jgi:copper(I)-binding protein
VSRSNKIRLAGAIAILIPVLAGCEAGLNAPTSEFHPAAFGGYVSPTPGTTGITVSNAFVLGAGLNQTLPTGSDASVFLSVFTTAPGGDELTKITTSSAASVTIDNAPVSLTSDSVARVTGPTPQIVLNNLTAPLSGGQTITLTLDFANAGDIPVQVPVESHAYAYATYAAPAPAAPTPTDTATADATATPNPDSTASPSSSAGAHSKHHKHASAPATPTPSPAA